MLNRCCCHFYCRLGTGSVLLYYYVSYKCTLESVVLSVVSCVRLGCEERGEREG